MKIIYVVKTEDGFDSFEVTAAAKEENIKKAFENVVSMTEFAFYRDQTMNISDKDSGKKYKIKARDIISIECPEIDEEFYFKLENK